MKQILSNLIYFIFKVRLKRRGKPNKLYLTFDDGPHPENTDKVLDVLQKHNTKAVFFMVGQEMEKYPEVVNRVIEHGHILGYHSYQHQSMKEMSIRQIYLDLKYAKKLSKEFAYPLNVYRPPYGDISFWGLLLLLFTGWKIIMWSRDSRDSFDSPDKVIENLSPSKIAGGEIILLHDDYDHTSRILSELLVHYDRAHTVFGVF